VKLNVSFKQVPSVLTPDVAPPLPRGRTVHKQSASVCQGQSDIPSHSTRSLVRLHAISFYVLPIRLRILACAPSYREDARTDISALSGRTWAYKGAGPTAPPPPNIMLTGTNSFTCPDSRIPTAPARCNCVHSEARDCN
jgi:hypothetical protein